MENTDLRLDVARFHRHVGGQHAVITHHGFERQTRARHVEHHAATEAVAQRGDLAFFHIGLAVEKLLRSLKATQRQRRILVHTASQRAGVRGIGRNLAVAVHIDHQRDIAFARQHARTLPCIIVRAPPLGHHQHPGTLALDGIVKRKKALHDGIACLIADVLAHHRGEGR